MFLSIFEIFYICNLSPNFILKNDVLFGKTFFPLMSLGFHLEVSRVWSFSEKQALRACILNAS